MKPSKIGGMRRMKGFTQSYVAEYLGIKIYSYRSREAGKTPFTDPEKVKLATLFNLTQDEFNDVFFDRELPFGKKRLETV